MKSWVRWGAGAVVAVLVALASGGGLARAQSQAEKNRIDGEIDSYRSQVQEASAEEARLLGELDDSRARKSQLDARVTELGTQLRAVERDLDTAARQLAAVEAEQRSAEARLAATQTELDAAQRRLVAYAVSAYTGQSEASRFVGTLLSSATIGELAARRSYVRAVGNTQAEIISRTERLRDEVDDLTRRLAAAQREAKVRRDAVDAERVRVESTHQAQVAVQAEVAAEIATTDRLRRQVVSRKAEFEAEIAELQRQSEEIAELLRRRAEEQARQARLAQQSSPQALDAGPGAGGFMAPIPGAPITSPFGWRVHPIYGDARLHTGVDIGASSGTPIRASAGGTVVSAGWLGGYGYATIIEHGGGLATLYAHQSSMGVSGGQRVSAGEIIGRVGCTGSCTGPHLHFEVRLWGSPVDPIPYIY